jgi:23S rRNA (cytidine1920-2'-O)/16S rRNA (cytidine1409-2'-O)-methyltransferase
MKQRLDHAVVGRELVTTRSQAESYIRLGKVSVNKKIITKPGFLVSEQDTIKLLAKEQYVSRAALKLASVVKVLKVNFKNKIVLDVGSSTGGFTDYALQHGAKKVVAIDVGTDQLHPTLRNDERIELHEKTDIRDVRRLLSVPDVVVIDVSFISLRNILPTVSRLSGPNTQVVAMVKPQFEAKENDQKHKGVIKNDAMRRKILQEFEAWVKELFVVQNKSDSAVRGEKGNTERFYLLHKIDK